MSEDYLEQLKQKQIKEYKHRMSNDIAKTERKKAMICKSCEYSEKFVGMMISYSNCQKCNKKLTSTNTDTDVYCLQCATMLQKCKSCGKPID